MERVLPDRDVKELLGNLAVGVAANCDQPEADVEAIMRANLKDARTLPFVAFVTHDGKWVEGFSGFKQSNAFLEVVQKADASPFLQATPATRKKLATLLARAQTSASKGYWKNVVKANEDFAKAVGRCPERKEMTDLMRQGRAWAHAEFDRAAQLARTPEGASEAKKVLADVRTQFSGEPEGDEAKAGINAVKRLEQIVKLEAAGKAADGVREKAAADYDSPRWKALFVGGDLPEVEKPKPAPADDAKPEKKEDEDDSEFEVG